MRVKQSIYQSSLTKRIIFQADLIIEENLQCPGTSKEIVLTAPDALELSVVDVINDCNNAGSGAIEVVAAGGSGSYAFTSNFGNIPQVANDTATFSNLFPSIYILTVTDTDAGADADAYVDSRPHLCAGLFEGSHRRLHRHRRFPGGVQSRQRVSPAGPVALPDRHAQFPSLASLAGYGSH